MEFTDSNPQGSLADMFRQKKQQMLQERFNSNEQAKPAEKKGGKTKEELFELRK